MVKSVSDYRKSEIVDAAIDVLVKEGLSAMSYDVIASEAGTSRQLVRHYYPNPNELMVDLCAYLAAFYGDILENRFESIGADKRLPTLINFYLNILSGEKRTKIKDDLSHTALVALAAQSPEIKQGLYLQYDEMKQVFVRELGVSYPSLSKASCDEIAYVFIAMYYGHWRMVASLGFDEAQNVILRDSIERLIASHAAIN